MDRDTSAACHIAIIVCKWDKANSVYNKLGQNILLKAPRNVPNNQNTRFYGTIPTDNPKAVEPSGIRFKFLQHVILFITSNNHNRIHTVIFNMMNEGHVDKLHAVLFTTCCCCCCCCCQRKQQKRCPASASAEENTLCKSESLKQTSDVRHSRPDAW